MPFLRILAVCAASVLALPLLGSTAAQAQERPESYAAYVAGRLAEDPVYVSDHYAGELDLDAAREHVRASVARLGVPAYVAVLPRSAGGDLLDGGFLAAVHDRLGEDGVYLLLEHSGATSEAAAYGTDLPIEDAALEALFALEYDTPVTVVVDRIVDTALSGETEARMRDASDSARYEPAPFSLGNPFQGLLDDLDSDTSAGRANQEFLTGTSLGAAVVFAWLWLRLRPGRRRSRAAANRGGSIR
ncbi:hypothetical protein [Actinorugispora endophytica]|uniref:Membrane protein YgcG n=1 Tax=Actinorugispora endophytica TaxID=1605990 RepID=A0A4R6UGB5_9ACTN|nr:hypothetical protein [Actinorugispora endophytica]TDQ45036.1 hypothetical protein EV190_13328 [Actinorugispora endophytica]